MKRVFIFAATALSTVLAFAGGVENKTNMIIIKKTRKIQTGNYLE